MSTENRLALTSTTHFRGAFITFIAANGLLGAINIMEIASILEFIMQERVTTNKKYMSVGM